MIEKSGGGRGRYRVLPGDFPVAALRGVKTQSNSIGMHAVETVLLEIIGKNVQSLQSVSREGELMAELRTIRWDVLALNETWREKQRERWITEDGHLFCGAGGKKGEQGVAIMIHRRWTGGFRALHAVNERVMAVDIDIGGNHLRLISIYMPHGGCDDEEVEGVYTKLDSIVCGARRINRVCVLLGDWNAVVGGRQAGDDEDVVGEFGGAGVRNSRGDWLVEWASSQRFMIADTLFERNSEDQWTYQNGLARRQLDYCLVDVDCGQCVKDAGAVDLIGVGADHRAVKMRLALPIKDKQHGQKRKRGGLARSMRGWRAENEDIYKRDLDEKLATIDDVADNLEQKCLAIEHALLDASKKCQVKSLDDGLKNATRERIHDLIGQRRDARKNGCKVTVKEASKLIQKELQAVRRARRSAKISKVLAEFKDLQRLIDIRNNGKQSCMTSMIGADGVEKTDKFDIAEVFAAFFESLYAGDGSEVVPGDDMDIVEAVTVDEIRSQLKRMRPRKAADDHGIIAEFLSKGSDLLMQMIADMFTSIMKPRTAVPDYWKVSSIRVLFKKGDERLPENYRPICIIPIMYKLFSRVLCGRIKDKLLAEQSEDQAGFRPNYSCDDHLFAITLLAEKCNEFNLPLWVATLDFKKAFDSITHASIWESLNALGVNRAYINILSRLYHGQRAQVKGDAMSRNFDILKGTKQGDPISPVIFNTVLEQVMRRVKTKWKERKYGVQLGYSSNTMVTNLRFADDILVVGRSLPQIKQMIADIVEEGAKVGLELHPAKTKIQHNNIGYGSRVRSARIGSVDIEVLEHTASTLYLGRDLSLITPHDTELKHRIKKAWAKFGVFRGELTDKGVSLHLRLKLFNAVLTPSILYGCGCWAMTTARDTTLRTTQMKMLRCILGRGRQVDNGTGEVETWVEWVQRVTREARQAMADNGVPDWVEEQRRRVSKWSDRLQNMDKARWARKVWDWQPEGRRSRGHPCTRWEEKLHR